MYKDVTGDECFIEVYPNSFKGNWGVSIDLSEDHQLAQVWLSAEDAKSFANDILKQLEEFI